VSHITPSGLLRLRRQWTRT